MNSTFDGGEDNRHFSMEEIIKCLRDMKDEFDKEDDKEDESDLEDFSGDVGLIDDPFYEDDYENGERRTSGEEWKNEVGDDYNDFDSLEGDDYPEF